MVKLDKIYTKAGDGGKTRLSTGELVDKFSPRVASYGSVDELNAALGFAALHASEAMLASIRRVQNDLFDLGADLATPDTDKDLGWDPLRIVSSQVTRLEGEIDKMLEALTPLDSFILPGGSVLAAQFHVARTICRRAERDIAALAVLEGEMVSPQSLAFINRLSDWLFVAGRVANNNGADDVKWVPGANR